MEPSSDIGCIFWLRDCPETGGYPEYGIPMSVCDHPCVVVDVKDIDDQEFCRYQICIITSFGCKTKRETERTIERGSHVPIYPNPPIQYSNPPQVKLRSRRELKKLSYINASSKYWVPPKILDRYGKYYDSDKDCFCYVEYKLENYSINKLRARLGIPKIIWNSPSSDVERDPDRTSGTTENYSQVALITESESQAEPSSINQSENRVELCSTVETDSQAESDCSAEAEDQPEESFTTEVVVQSERSSTPGMRNLVEQIPTTQPDCQQMQASVEEIDTQLQQVSISLPNDEEHSSNQLTENPGKKKGKKSGKNKTKKKRKQKKQKMMNKKRNGNTKTQSGADLEGSGKEAEEVDVNSTHHQHDEADGDKMQDNSDNPTSPGQHHSENPLYKLSPRGATVIHIGSHIFRVRGKYPQDSPIFSRVARYWFGNYPEDVQRVIRSNFDASVEFSPLYEHDICECDNCLGQ